MELASSPPQDEMMDYDLMMNEAQLYQTFFPQDDIFLNSALPSLSTDVSTLDYFEDPENIEVQPPIFIKPDPDAPVQRPPSPQIVHTDKRRRMTSSDITSKTISPQAVKSESKQHAKLDLAARLQEQDEKYLKRLEANKKSAQASRERKKHLKDELEKKVLDITAENRRMATEITQLETENKVLKGEFIQLQKIISDSPVLSKLMDRATSMQLALSDKERTMQGEEIPSSTTPSSNTAAFMYLMIVLQSFGQYFAAKGQAPNIDFMNLRPPVEVM